MISSGIVILTGLVWGCEASESTPAPDRTSEGSGITTAIDVDSLTLWTAQLQLLIGGESLPGHDFVYPIALGAHEGDIFVLDPHLREVRRFDAEGRFADLIVRPGEGPGEMRVPPRTFGLRAGNIWYTEEPSGRIHSVASNGSSRSSEDTGWTAARLGTGRMSITPIAEDSAYLLRTESRDLDFEGLRPPVRVQYFRTHGNSAALLHEYVTSGSSILLDEGRTMVKYAGPADHTVSFHDERRLLRIDRPLHRAEARALVALRLINESGEVIRESEITWPAATLGAVLRDSIHDAIVRGATWGGARSLDSGVRRDIAQLVSEIPDQLPGFDEAVRGPEGTTWLRRTGGEKGRMQEWLVLDSLFNPAARAHHPGNTTHLAFREDGDWWATLGGIDDAPSVVRLKFSPSDSNGR